MKAGYPSVHTLKVGKLPTPSPELNPQTSLKPPLDNSDVIKPRKGIFVATVSN